MFRKYFYFLKKSDWLLSVVAIFLVVFGLVMIYSIESAAEDSQLLNFNKQIIFFSLGLLFLIFFSVLDYRYLKTYGYVFFVVGLIILIGVLVFGTAVRGTRSWIFIFGEQGFQPVELVKIFLIVILAKKFSDWRSEINSYKNLLLTLVLAGSLITLVFLQPDFGSSVILIAIFIGMLLLTKVKKSYLLMLLLLLIIIFTTSWVFMLRDYQKERVLTFLDPGRDPWRSGYNIKQSIIAVGSGSLFGRGLSLGPQSRLNFLPVQQTDFIYAVVAEELGFVGSTLLLVLLVILIYRLFRIIRLSRDDFGIYVLCGIIIYFFSQSAMNIGMNVGLLPIAGVPLPFVSYGGSSLLASFIAIGIAQSVWIRHEAMVPGQ